MCRSLLVAMLMSIATLAPVAAAADAQLAALQNHDALAKEVTQTLRIDELLAVMSAEALGDIGGDVNPESGGDPWRDAVERIYEPARMRQIFDAELSRRLTMENEAAVQAALRFFKTGLGKSAREAELTARRQLLTQRISERATDEYHDAQRQRLPRLAQIQRMLAVTDAVELNVRGALKAYSETSRGFAIAQGSIEDTGESRADTRNLEREMRRDITDWIETLLLMAYKPLTDREVEALITFARTAEAKTMNQLLNATFDSVFSEIAFEIGIITGAGLAGDEI